jgi:predicted dehydrogenase
MLRCAIVGVGRWGQRLVDSCQKLGQPFSESLHFTHAVARTPEKYANYCAQQQLTLLGDYEAALADDNIDAVVLATPHSQHFEQIDAAAKAGKHVFVEKPFTLNQNDAILAAESAHHAGIVLAVGHNRRFLPAMQDLKTMIDNGELGTVTHIEGNFSGPFGLSYNPSMWRASAAESPAGGMTAMGIHIVDTFIHLCGPISAVRAHSLGHVLDVDIDDTTSIMLNFENGVSGMFSTLCATARQWRIQVFGTKGWAQLRDHHVFDTCFNEQQHAETKTYTETDIEFAELKAFAEACQNGASYPVTLEEAVHGIAVQDAIIESAQSSGSLKPIAQHSTWHPTARDEVVFAASRLERRV